MRLVVVLALLVVWRMAAAQPSAPGPQFKGAVLDIRGHVENVAPAARPIAQASSGWNVRETDAAIKIELAADILFDFDRADLRPGAQQALQQIAGLIREKGQHGIVIEGHTDAKGTSAHNQPLSLARAKSVQSWLIRQGGLSAMPMNTIGYGATRPVAPNTLPNGKDNPDGRQKNRRVEITVPK